MNFGGTKHSDHSNICCSEISLMVITAVVVVVVVVNVIPGTTIQVET